MNGSVECVALVIFCLERAFHASQVTLMFNSLSLLSQNFHAISALLEFLKFLDMKMFFSDLLHRLLIRIEFADLDDRRPMKR